MKTTVSCKLRISELALSAGTSDQRYYIVIIACRMCNNTAVIDAVDTANYGIINTVKFLNYVLLNSLRHSICFILSLLVFPSLQPKGTDIIDNAGITDHYVMH